MCTKGTVPLLPLLPLVPLIFRPTNATTNAGERDILKTIYRPGCDSTVQVSRSRSSLLRDRYHWGFQDPGYAHKPCLSAHCRITTPHGNHPGTKFPFPFPFIPQRHLLVFRALMTLFRSLESLESDCVAPSCKPPGCVICRCIVGGIPYYRSTVKVAWLIGKL